MGSRVGALLIDMAMNTAAFASDLRTSTNNLNSWSSTSNKALANVVNGYRGLSKEVGGFIDRTFTLKNAMLTLVGGGVIGAFVKAQLDAASAIVDTADNIGVTTKTLQEYTYAAGQSGVATTQLHGALETFAKSVGDAHAGTGKLAAFLKQANPELLKQVTAATSVDEALNLLYGTMSKLTNQEDRLALASAAFGKTNLEMVNLVKDGTGALEEMRRKAEALGLVMDDSLLRKAEDAGDKFDTLTAVIKTQLTVAVIENAEEIGNFAEAVAEAIPHIANFATALVEGVTALLDWDKTLLMAQQDLIKIGATAQLVTMYIGSMWGGSTKDMEDFAAKTDQELKAIDEKIKNLGKEGGSSKPLNAVTELDAALKGGATQGVAGYAEAMRKQAIAAEEAEGALKKLKSQADAIKKESSPFNEYNEQLEKLNAMLKAGYIDWDVYAQSVDKAKEKLTGLQAAADKVYQDNRTPQQQYNLKMMELNALVQSGKLDMETYGLAVDKAGGELRKAQMEGSLFGSIMDKAIDGNIKSWRDLGSAVVDFGKILFKNLANGQGMGNAFGGSSGGGLLGGLLGGLGGLGSILGGGGGAVYSGFGADAGISWGATLASLFHSGGKVGSGGAMRRVNPMVFAGAQKFHNGGLVGDEVPAILKKGETVMTEQQQRTSGGKRVVIEYLDARGADAGVEQRLRAMIMELNGSIEGRSVNAVRDARLRDPGLFD